MKGTVLAQGKVQDLLKQFVIAELYTDGTPWAKENQDLQKTRFKQPALPLYLVLGPDGKERSRLVGMTSEKKFIEFLMKGLKPPPPK